MKLYEIECLEYNSLFIKIFSIQTIVTPADTVSTKMIFRAFYITLKSSEDSFRRNSVSWNNNRLNKNIFLTVLFLVKKLGLKCKKVSCCVYYR